MKAIITNDQGDVGNLKLRIAPEGANDRTLMLLLEQQYPIIHRTNDYLEIPIASQDDIDLPVAPGGVMEIRSDWDVCNGTTVRVKSDPWRYAAIRGATLRISQPCDWWVKSLAVNGRMILDGDTRPGTVKGWNAWDLPRVAIDVHPGTIVTLEAILNVANSTCSCPGTCQCPDLPARALIAWLIPLDRMPGNDAAAAGEGAVGATQTPISILANELGESLSQEQQMKIASVLAPNQIALLVELMNTARMATAKAKEEQQKAST